MQFRVNKPESTNLYCEVCPRDTRIFSPLKCLLGHLKSIAYSHCRTASSAHHGTILAHQISVRHKRGTEFSSLDISLPR